MKPLAPVPPLTSLQDVPPERLGFLMRKFASLDDSAYLHWDKLRHLSPPDGLSVREWWLALKLKRLGSRLEFPELRAIDGRTLSVSRHARMDAGVATMDRLLAGRIELPEVTRDGATRDQYVVSSLMEEAIHSSLFEGAVSTREAAKDMLRSNRRPTTRDERMILNNYRAMTRLREMAKSPLTEAMVLELHRTVTEGTLDNPAMAGHIQRPGESRIRIVDDRVNRVVHTPPSAEHLPERMHRLIEFANADDVSNDQFVHPVLRSILLHFQLAYDHPFHDGNGRTARALFYWSMLRRGYWLVEFFSISRLLYRSRSPYELAYLQVESDEQDATYFVLQQLEVLQQAIDGLYRYVERKSRAQRLLRQHLQGREDLNHRQLALLDHALRNPDALYTHESHANSHRVSTITARSDLQDLVRRKWLNQSKSGKRLVYQPQTGLEQRLERH